MIDPEFNLGRGRAQIYTEKFLRFHVRSVYTVLAFGASVRVLFALKKELTRETLISG